MDDGVVVNSLERNPLRRMWMWMWMFDGQVGLNTVLSTVESMRPDLYKSIDCSIDCSALLCLAIDRLTD